MYFSAFYTENAENILCAIFHFLKSQFFSSTIARNVDIIEIEYGSFRFRKALRRLDLYKRSVRDMPPFFQNLPVPLKRYIHSYSNIESQNLTSSTEDFVTCSSLGLRKRTNVTPRWPRKLFALQITVISEFRCMAEKNRMDVLLFGEITVRFCPFLYLKRYMRIRT